MDPPPPPQNPNPVSPGRAATPSTSGPFFPPPVRITGQSPPLKRRRTRSKPRSTPSALDQDAEIAKAREASALRLLDVWSGLAEKYARGLDEDDVIDVITGKLVEDRGVMARTKKSYRVGYFQQGEGEETEVEDEEPDIDDSEGVTEPDAEIDADEDEDELDTLSKIASKQKVESITLKERNVPPVQVDQEVDAEQLREFLEEEKRRKERYGEEESSSEDSDAQGDDTKYRVHAEYVDDDDEEEEEPENATLGASSDWDIPPPSSTTEVFDSDEDELASNWQIDEASIIIPVTETPTRASQPVVSDTDSDSEIEIIGPPRLVDRQTFSRGLPTSRASTSFVTPYRYQRQLDTPPLTHSSSSIPSSTPFDEREQHLTSSLSISTLPPSSPPPSSPRTSPLPSSSPRRSVYATSPIISATPKPSSKFKPHSSPPPPITRLDLPKAMPSRFRTPSKRAGPTQTPVRSLPPSRYSANTHDTFSDPGLPVATDDSDADSIRKQRNCVEVVITRRTPAPKENKRSLPTKESSPVVPTVPPASKKGKGKEKADIPKFGPLSVDSQEEDTLPIASSPIKTPSVPKHRNRRRRSESQPPSTATSPVALLSKKPLTPRARVSTSPELELPPPSWSRKRKRVVSAEQKGERKAASRSPSVSEDDDDIFTELPPITKSKVRSQSHQRPDPEPVKHGMPQHSQPLAHPSDYLLSNDTHYSLATPHSGHRPSAYTPFADPNFQFVMAQAVQHAMQQYDAMVHSPHAHPHTRWTGSTHPPMVSMPFHPPPPSTYYHHPSLPPSMAGPSMFMSPASSSSSSYSYGAPVLRDHIGPRETPSSDNTDHLSSPGIPTSVAAHATTTPARRKSLVHRSQSKGRKVSFRGSEEITLLETSREISPDGIPIKVSKNITSSTYQIAASTKGKGKAESTARQSTSSRFMESPDGHKSGDEFPRGRPMARAQTPGPSVAANARHDTKTGAKLKPVVSDTTEAKKKSRSRKG